MRPVVLVVLLLSSVLAGCSGSGSGDGGEVIATSTLPDVTEATSEGKEPAKVEPPKAGTRGHISGHVVSSDIRPIRNATVKLPGMDIVQKSDREGRFGFVDLRPGPYFVTVEAAGFYPAEAEVEVTADRFSRLKFVLTPIPPPDPYHQTQSFDAYAEVTDAFLLRSFFCSGCQIPLYIEANPKTMIIEAVADGSGIEFDMYLEEQDRPCCDYLVRASGPSPFRLEIPGEQIPGGTTAFNLQVYARSLVPETAKSFQVFVTTFYNEPAPPGWSFVDGDP